MGEQSFTNEGALGGEGEGREAASAISELPSFRRIAPPTTPDTADHHSSVLIEPARKPSVDKKHFVIREGAREAPSIARPRVPPLPVAGRTDTRSAKKSRGTDLMRSSAVLIIGLALGYVGAYLFPGPTHPVGAEIARAPSDRWSTATLSAFVDQAERQIGERRLEMPPGDNGLETYRRMAARWPANAETRSVGEHLSVAFSALALTATQRGDWAEATRYFDIIKALPVPTHASLVATEAASPEPVTDGAQPAAAHPTVAADAPAQANGPSPSAQAAAAASDDHAWQAAIVALRRGDQAMRLGDIVSARHFYEFAAGAGITEAATDLGQTYDPAYLKSAGVRGVKANPETARGWYTKAADQGDSRAAQLLQSLGQN